MSASGRRPSTQQGNRGLRDEGRGGNRTTKDRTAYVNGDSEDERDEEGTPQPFLRSKRVAFNSPPTQGTSAVPPSNQPKPSSPALSTPRSARGVGEVGSRPSSASNYAGVSLG